MEHHAEDIIDAHKPAENEALTEKESEELLVAQLKDYLQTTASIVNSNVDRIRELHSPADFAVMRGRIELSKYASAQLVDGRVAARDLALTIHELNVGLRMLQNALRDVTGTSSRAKVVKKIRQRRNDRETGNVEDGIVKLSLV